MLGARARCAEVYAPKDFDDAWRPTLVIHFSAALGGHGEN